MTEMNTMIRTDDSGQEREVEIILSFEDESTGKTFVLFSDPQDEEGNVYAYRYDEDGNMNEVTDENEWEMCQEVLGAFAQEDEADED